MQEQEAVNKHWSDSSDNYDDIIKDELNSFRVQGWKRLFSKELGEDKKHVLDTGCGPGFFSIVLSECGYDVTGIDASECMLQKAKKNAKEYNADVKLMLMDCHEMDFPDNTFDAAVSRNLTHTLIDHKKVYENWFRVLKPSGILLIFDANWHLPFASRDMFLECMSLKRRCIEKYGSDFSGNTKYEPDKDLEYFNQKQKHRLGDLLRPDFDVGLLVGTGFTDISYDRDITCGLWDSKEELIYANTPLFMIKAIKA